MMIANLRPVIANLIFIIIIDGYRGREGDGLRC
jgi:hypothetical protein